MTNYRHPEQKATETVTFRLTRKERHLLDHLAKVEGQTLTDFVRGLLTRRAAELEISEIPPPSQKKRRPGRPKKQKVGLGPHPLADQSPPLQTESASSVKKAIQDSQDLTIIEQPTGPVSETERGEDPQIPVTIVPPEPPEMTLADIITRFRTSFSHRAEGTKKEFEDTIQFFCNPEQGFPLLSLHTPVSRLTSELLSQVREEMKPLNLRVAKKNLHLTYLRMMLHWAVKEPDIGLVANPGLTLNSFTISEIPESWPGKSFPTD